MAKSYSVNFDIRGSIDGSLLNSIKKAQKDLEALGKLNGKALANAQKYSAATKKLADIEHYKDLTRAVQAAAKARANELVTANRQLAAQKKANQQLADMKKSYQELQRVQARLKQNAQVQRNGLDLVRADLKNAKASGDVAAIRAAQQALSQQQQAAARAALEVRNLNAALKQGREELKAQQNHVKEIDNNFAQSSQRAQQLQQQLQTQHAQLNQLRATAPQNLGQAETHLRQEIQATTAALQQEIAAIERRNKVFNDFSQRQQDVANAYSNFQNAVDTAQTIMNPFKDAADNAKTFEYALSQVKALTSMQNIRDGNIKQVEKDMAALTAQAERLGATTEFTATEVAEAMKYYGYAGWNAAQIQAVMDQTVDFSSVTGKHNIARAADIFSDDLTILGIKAGDKIQLAGGKMVDAVTHTFDNYSYAITKANMDEEALHTSLTYNAPAMLLAGLTQGEVFAANMIAANAGLKGSTSGTAFRTGWIRMLAPPKKGAKALEELGMTATESQKQMAAASEAFAELGVTETSTARDRLMALKTAWDANEMLGEEGRSKNAAMLDAIIGKNAFSTWANLFKGNNLEQMFEWADYMDSGKTAGWTADTAKVMRDNTQTSIELLKSSIDALQKAAGDALLPALRGAAEVFAPLITSAAEFVAQNPRIVQACAAIATAFSTAIVAVAGFSLAMAGVRFAQAGLATASLLFGNLSASILTAARAAMAFVVTPVGAVVAALALAALYAYQNWDRVAPAIDRVADIFNQILPAVDNAKNALSTFADAFNLDGLSNAVSTLASGIGGTLVGAIITAAGAIATALTTVINFALNLHTLVTDVATSIVGIFKAISEGDLTGIAAAVHYATDIISKDLDNISSDFVNNISDGLKATNAALETYMHPTKTVSGTVQAGLNAMPSSFDTTAAQGNIDALGVAAQAAATGMQGLEMVGPNMTQAGDAAQSSTQNFTTAGENAVNAGTQFQMAGEAAANSVGGLQAMVDGASAVAGALSAKAGEIAAIQINVPQVNYVPMNIGVPAGVAHNAAGGFYKKGAFLTTFAEESPEVAIPINNSARSVNLWQQAGSALGMFDDAAQPISINISVNISGNADAATVQRGVEQSLPRVRSFAQELAEYRHNQARRSFL